VPRKLRSSCPAPSSFRIRSASGNSPSNTACRRCSFRRTTFALVAG
jgi:hypothetical protein